MAIIKCPECGHQVSDKAPTCPNCGVEIAGKIKTCQHCGNAFFSEYAKCPNCKQSDKLSNKREQAKPQTNIKKAKTKKINPYIIIVLLAVIVAAGGLYIYKENRSKKELQAYEIAMKSSDFSLLKNFLYNFADAPQAHIDSIKARIENLNNIDEEWDNVKATRSKIALQDYLDKYPQTQHKGEIENLLDSIDWQQALRSNNNDMFQQYINNHPYGKYAEDAKEKINQLKAKTLQPEEQQMIALVVRKFFLSVNKRDEASLTSTLSPLMTSFLELRNPSDIDVKRWMNRLYKDDVAEIVWTLNNDYAISKREVGENAYEYTAIFTASEQIKNIDETKSTTLQYKVTTQISPDGKITAMAMNKLFS